MARWLLKTEPDCYSWDDFARDKSTRWDGVTNALALKHMRAMKKGDDVFVYHTGGDKAVIGTGKITRGPYADPNADDERVVAVDVRIGAKLPSPVTLAEIRADRAFVGWDLIRNSRLGVMPVPDAMWERIGQLAKDSRTARPAGLVKEKP